MLPSDFLPLLEAGTRHQAVEKSYGKGEHLFWRGDAPIFMYYVVAGEARLLRRSRRVWRWYFSVPGRDFWPRPVSTNPHTIVTASPPRLRAS